MPVVEIEVTLEQRTHGRVTASLVLQDKLLTVVDQRLDDAADEVVP